MSGQSGDYHYDGFISYSHEDRHEVTRLQSFLEDFSLPGDELGQPKELTLFRDTTDIKAGELSSEINDALKTSRHLLVCCSLHVVESQWVSREIELFSALAEGNPDRSIILVILGGQPPACIPNLLRDQELLWLDLRNARRLGFLKPAARVDLLRALALLSGVPLRKLIPWDERRRRRRVLSGMAIGVAVLLVIGISVFNWWRERENARFAELETHLTEAENALRARNLPAAVQGLHAIVTADTDHRLQRARTLYAFWRPRLASITELITEAPISALFSISGELFIKQSLNELRRVDAEPPFLAARAIDPSLIVLSDRSGVSVLHLPDLSLVATKKIDERFLPEAAYRLDAAHAMLVLGYTIEVHNDEDEPYSIDSVLYVVNFLQAGAPYAGEQALTVEKAIAVIERFDFDGKFTPEKVGTTKEGRIALQGTLIPSGDWGEVERRVEHLVLSRGPEGRWIEVSEPTLAATTFERLVRPQLPDDPAPDVIQFPHLLNESVAWEALPEEQPETSLPQEHSVGKPLTYDFSGVEDGERYSLLLTEFSEPFRYSSGDADVIWNQASGGNSWYQLVSCELATDGATVLGCREAGFTAILAKWQSSNDRRHFYQRMCNSFEPSLQLVNLRTLEVLATDVPPDLVVGATYSPDSEYLIALTDHDQLWIYDIIDDGYSLRQRIPITVSPNSNVELFDPKANIESCESGRALQFLDKRTVVGITRDQRLFSVDIASGEISWLRDPVAEWRQIRPGIIPSANGAFFVVGGRKSLQLFEASAGWALSDRISPEMLYSSLGLASPEYANFDHVDVGNDGSLEVLVGERQRFHRSVPNPPDSKQTPTEDLPAITGLTSDGVELRAKVLELLPKDAEVPH